MLKTYQSARAATEGRCTTPPYLQTRSCQLQARLQAAASASGACPDSPNEDVSTSRLFRLGIRGAISHHHHWAVPMLSLKEADTHDGKASAVGRPMPATDGVPTPCAGSRPPELFAARAGTLRTGRCMTTLTLMALMASGLPPLLEVNSLASNPE